MQESLSSDPQPTQTQTRTQTRTIGSSLPTHVLDHQTSPYQNPLNDCIERLSACPLKRLCRVGSFRLFKVRPVRCFYWYEWLTWREMGRGEMPNVHIM